MARTPPPSPPATGHQLLGGAGHHWLVHQNKGGHWQRPACGPLGPPGSGRGRFLLEPAGRWVVGGQALPCNCSCKRQGRTCADAGTAAKCDGLCLLPAGAAPCTMRPRTAITGGRNSVAMRTSHCAPNTCHYPHFGRHCCIWRPVLQGWLTSQCVWIAEGRCCSCAAGQCVQLWNPAATLALARPKPSNVWPTQLSVGRRAQCNQSP